MNLRAQLTMHTKKTVLVAAIIAAAIVIHTPLQRLQYLNLHLPDIHLIRSIVFFLSIGYLIFLVGTPVLRYLLNSGHIFSPGRLTMNTIAIFALTSLLVFPATLGIMGVGYAQMSISPFSFFDSSDQLYQRLLMPAVSYVLHLKGPVFYHLFSLMLAFCGIMLLQVFFLQRNVTLSMLEYVSIAASSFIITQFQSPGYTEALSYIIIFILLIVDMDEIERVALFALSLFAHEASVVLLLAMSVVFFSKRDTILIVGLAVFYGFIWLASFGFDLRAMMAVRTVGNYSTIEWIVKYPLRELLGIIVSFKALWFFMIAALLKLKEERTHLILLLMPGIVLTLVAVDTSRMVGFSFVALIYSILYIKQHHVLSDRQFRFVSILNLCIPAVYVGVNSGIVYFDGLYQLLQFGVFLK